MFPLRFLPWKQTFTRQVGKAGFLFWQWLGWKARRLHWGAWQLRTRCLSISLFFDPLAEINILYLGKRKALDLEGMPMSGRALWWPTMTMTTMPTTVIPVTLSGKSSALHSWPRLVSTLIMLLAPLTPTSTLIRSHSPSLSTLPPSPSPHLSSFFCCCWRAHLRSRSFHYLTLCRALVAWRWGLFLTEREIVCLLYFWCRLECIWVYVCVYTHTHAHYTRSTWCEPGVGTGNLEGPKNPDGLNLVIYVIVYLYKVHMFTCMLKGGMGSKRAAFIFDHIFLPKKQSKRCERKKTENSNRNRIRNAQIINQEY